MLTLFVVFVFVDAAALTISDGLFGDTVNTASRMETNSQANRILCSERSYKLLKEQAPKIRSKKRGKISVKGKGEMNVFWVGSRSNLPPKDPSKEFLPKPEASPAKKVDFEEDPTESDVEADLNAAVKG